MEKKTYFISADLEGVTDVTAWDETLMGMPGYEAARLQMTREVAAACEAVLEAGGEAVVRDGHDCARNILHELLPRGVKLMRGWACHPGGMMAGISGEYAGAFFIGYHSPAGTDKSPLAHTINKNVIRCLKINGRIASEFTVNSMFAAQAGVPSLFISGDEGICELASEEIPGICSVAVKKCRGNSTFNMHPLDACDQIRQEAARALKSEIPVRRLPGEIEVEVRIQEHQKLRMALANPSVRRTGEDTVSFTARTPREVNFMLDSIIG